MQNECEAQMCKLSRRDGSTRIPSLHKYIQGHVYTEFNQDIVIFRYTYYVAGELQ
jgi:hypothetical protein